MKGGDFMETIQDNLTELGLKRIQELKAVQEKLSLADIVDSLLGMNKALKELIFDKNELDIDIFSSKKGYAAASEIRLRAIDQYRKNCDFIFKITSIPLELVTKDTKEKGFTIETITPLALPSNED